MVLKEDTLREGTGPCKTKGGDYGTWKYVGLYRTVASLETCIFLYVCMLKRHWIACLSNII